MTTTQNTIWAGMLFFFTIFSSRFSPLMGTSSLFALLPRHTIIAEITGNALAGIAMMKTNESP